jgi:hypothetical protein
MNLFRKSVISFAGVAAAALLLAISSPRTVHALGVVGATLVRITNTAEVPAISEEVPHLASRSVTLVGFVASPSYGEPFLQMTPQGTVPETAFVVPAGQSFVITGVDVTPPNSAPAWVNVGSYAGGWYGSWSTASAASAEFQYPTGIVVGNGQELAIYGSEEGLSVIVHGYLTNN